MNAKTCANCDTIHGSDAARAVGRFNPEGVTGYQSRLGGPVRSTRTEAVTDYCEAQR
jgi:hypothetical protein